MKTKTDYLAQAFDALAAFCRAVCAGDWNAADDADCVFLGALIRASHKDAFETIRHLKGFDT